LLRGTVLLARLEVEPLAEPGEPVPARVRVELVAAGVELDPLRLARRLEELVRHVERDVAVGFAELEET